MKLINLFETKSSLTVRWVWIFRKNWPNSGEISQKTFKCAAKPEMDGGHFVFWDIEPGNARPYFGKPPRPSPRHTTYAYPLLRNNHSDIPATSIYRSISNDYYDC